MTPEELSAAARQLFAYAARYVSVITRNNPRGTVGELLARPDVTAVLTDTLDRAREAAAEAVRQEWAASGSPQHEYLDWLVADVHRSYAALGQLRGAVRVGWAFPVAERPAAVRDAVLDTGADLALRNRLTLEVAAAAARTLRQVADGEERELAGDTVWKQWLCSHSPPDARTCHWCRALHGLIVPLHASFPEGLAADLSGHGRPTRPPRWYRRWRLGPPRHPRCRCRIKILTQLPPVSSGDGGQGDDAAATAPQQAAGEPAVPAHSGALLAAADIRALPEDRYQALLHFLKAAAHELSQLLAQLRKVLGT